MKQLLTFLMLSCSLLVASQDIERETIVGKIIVEGSDLEGITIYNTASKKGTVTDKSGKFILAVTTNDLLEIRALEYQSIDVRVNKAILESNKMSVYLIEKMNILDEVIIPKKELSGSLITDINKLEPFNPKLNAFYFEIDYDEVYSLNDDSDSQIKYLDKNDQGKNMVNGLDVVNVVDQLLIPLFRSEVKDKEEAGVPEVPAENIKYYLGSDFLVENFSIPEHRVEEFIRYVEDDSFDYDLLNYGHEIEFLELLGGKSKSFLKTPTGFE